MFIQNERQIRLEELEKQYQNFDTLKQQISIPESVT